MICDESFKYTCYLEPDSEELYNMKSDRSERTNLASSPEYSDNLKYYRNLLRRYLAETGDPFLSLKTEDTEHFRCHLAGFKHHEGASALEQYTQNLKRK